MREFFDLGNNALFVKFVRSRLRKAALLPALIIAAVLCIGVIIFDEKLIKPNRPDSTFSQQAFFVLQGLILFLMGGSQVAAAVSHINESGIIDFHRVTPMPSKVQTIGILLGAPIRELLVYSVTLPFSVYVALAGPVGITGWCKLLLVQLGAAVMYYTLAMVAGMSAKSGKGASGRFVTLLAVLNFAAGRLYPFGVYGPTLLTVVPVYEEVFPDMPRGQAQQQMQQAQQAQQMQPPPGQKAGMQPGAGQNPNAQPGQGPQGPQQRNRGQRGQPPGQPREITFYSAPIPVVLQSLMFQGTFITFMFIAASRRIRSSRLPLYSKPMALLFFGCIAVLTLGSVWDSARALQVLGMVYFLTICAMMLTSTVTPVLGDVTKGMQRAWKMSSSRVPPWSDLTTNKFVVLLFAAILALATTVAITASPDQPMPWFIQFQNEFQPWQPLAVGVAVVLLFGFSMQYFHVITDRKANAFLAMLIVFGWLLPMMVGGFLSNTNEDLGNIVMAVSPITGIANAGGVSIDNTDPRTIQFAAIAPWAIFGAVFALLLVSAERKLRDRVHSENHQQVRKGEGE